MQTAIVGTIGKVNVINNERGTRTLVRLAGAPVSVSIKGKQEISEGQVVLARGRLADDNGYHTLWAFELKAWDKPIDPNDATAKYRAGFQARGMVEAIEQQGSDTVITLNEGNESNGDRQILHLSNGHHASEGDRIAVKGTLVITEELDDMFPVVKIKASVTEIAPLVRFTKQSK